MKIKGIIKEMLIVKNKPRNFSGAVVGSLGSVQSQIVPYSSLYLFSRSIDAPQMSPVLNAGF